MLAGWPVNINATPLAALTLARDTFQRCRGRFVTGIAVIGMTPRFETKRQRYGLAFFDA